MSEHNHNYKNQEKLTERINSLIEEFIDKVAEVYHQKGFASTVNERTHVILSKMFAPLPSYSLSTSLNVKTQALSYNNWVSPQNNYSEQMKIQKRSPFHSTKIQRNFKNVGERRNQPQVKKVHNKLGIRFLPDYEMEEKLSTWLLQQMKVRKTIITKKEISIKAKYFSKDRLFGGSQAWTLKYFRRHPLILDAYKQHKEECTKLIKIFKKYLPQRKKSNKLNVSPERQAVEISEESFTPKQETTNKHYYLFND